MKVFVLSYLFSKLISLFLKSKKISKLAKLINLLTNPKMIEEKIEAEDNFDEYEIIYL
jgi:hypothetical protein